MQPSQRRGSHSKSAPAVDGGGNIETICMSAGLTRAAAASMLAAELWLDGYCALACQPVTVVTVIRQP